MELFPKLIKRVYNDSIFDPISAFALFMIHLVKSYIPDSVCIKYEVVKFLESCNNLVSLAHQLKYLKFFFFYFQEGGSKDVKEEGRWVQYILKV